MIIFFGRRDGNCNSEWDGASLCVTVRAVRTPRWFAQRMSDFFHVRWADGCTLAASFFFAISLTLRSYSHMQVTPGHLPILLPRHDLAKTGQVCLLAKLTTLLRWLLHDVDNGGDHCSSIVLSTQRFGWARPSPYSGFAASFSWFRRGLRRAVGHIPGRCHGRRISRSAPVPFGSTERHS